MPARDDSSSDIVTPPAQTSSCRDFCILAGKTANLPLCVGHVTEPGTRRENRDIIGEPVMGSGVLSLREGGSTHW
jgi:hypothetical protein